MCFLSKYTYSKKGGLSWKWRKYLKLGDFYCKQKRFLWKLAITILHFTPAKGYVYFQSLDYSLNYRCRTSMWNLQNV
jgi:hypothetical protein